MIAQRHVLAHDYADIDDELIWAVVAEHIPKLIPQLEAFAPAPQK